MSIAEFESLSLTVDIGGLVLYMLFIMYKLGRESKAGKFGNIALFSVLGLGIFGFIAKTVLVEALSL